MSETRVDAFLGGRVSIRQPSTGYRAGADPVFLAASVPAVPGASVLELGCGVGTMLLCLASRVGNLRLAGVEREPALADLARENVDQAGLDAVIWTADIAELPTEIVAENFDHVAFNPPFFDRTEGSRSSHPMREGGRGASETLSFWVQTALRRLRPGGTLSIVHRMESLPDALTALNGAAGEISVLPLQPRRFKPAKLVLLRARKGSRTPFRLLAPLILHTGDRHKRDGDSYTPEASAILRDGAPISLDR